MSIVSFILNNSGLVGSITGFSAVAVLGGTIFSINPKDPENHLFREVPEGENEKWMYAMDGKEFKEIQKVPHSYKDILNGTKEYSEGNYVIYYGSEACPHCTGMLFGDQKLSSGNLDLKRDKMSDGAWMKSYHYTKANEELKEKNIKFIMYEDVPDSRNPKFTDNLWTLPWAQETDGRFIRNDSSARDFRKLFFAARERFKDKVPGTPTVIIYKEGIPKVFNHDDLPGYEAKKQDESLSNADELKRFIKHYFLSVTEKQ